MGENEYTGVLSVTAGGYRGWSRGEMCTGVISVNAGGYTGWSREK